MYDIIMNVNWDKNYSAKNTKTGEPCAVCGKRIAEPKHYVRLFWGTTAVTEAEAQEIIAREGEGGDLLYYPVGSDCLKRQPELKPYVEDAKNTEILRIQAEENKKEDQEAWKFVNYLGESIEKLLDENGEVKP